MASRCPSSDGNGYGDGGDVLVRSLQRSKAWSRPLAIERFEAKLAEIDARLSAVAVQAEALVLEASTLRKMREEVVSTLDAERLTASVRNAKRRSRDLADDRVPSHKLSPQAKPGSYDYAVAIEAWRRPKVRTVGSTGPIGLADGARVDVLTQRAALVFGVPGLFHLMAVAEGAHRRISVEADGVPKDAHFIALAPRLGNCIFSLSAFQALMDPQTSNDLIQRLDEVK